MASGHCRDGRPDRPHASVAPMRGTCMRVGGARECRGWQQYSRDLARDAAVGGVSRRGSLGLILRARSGSIRIAGQVDLSELSRRPTGPRCLRVRWRVVRRHPAAGRPAGADDAEGPHGRRQPGHGARRWRSSAPRPMRASRSVSPRGGIESTSWTSNRAGTGRRSVRVGRRNMRPVRSRRLWMRRLFPSSTGACMFAHESSPPSCAWWPPAGSSASASLSRRSWEANPFRHGSSGSWRPS